MSSLTNAVNAEGSNRFGDGTKLQALGSAVLQRGGNGLAPRTFGKLQAGRGSAAHRLNQLGGSPSIQSMSFHITSRGMLDSRMRVTTSRVCEMFCKAGHRQRDSFTSFEQDQLDIPI